MHLLSLRKLNNFVVEMVLAICVKVRMYIDYVFNSLQTKGRSLYLRPSPYRAVNTFHLGNKNQSVYAVSGTSRCLFSDKYKTHKYSVGRAYSC